MENRILDSLVTSQDIEDLHICPSFEARLMIPGLIDRLRAFGCLPLGGMPMPTIEAKEIFQKLHDAY